MTDPQFGIAVILALWFAGLSLVLLGNYAAGTLRHDEDESEEFR